jgi:nucleotide-binding universal stress UspA family protein
VFRRILVGLDGSQGSFCALDAAATLARSFGAELWALGVAEKIPRYAATMGEVDDALDDRTTSLEETMREAAMRALGHGIELFTDIVTGNVAEAIIRYGQQYHFDLIVLGAQGRHALHNLFIGSVTDRVGDQAACSVLIVR